MNRAALLFPLLLLACSSGPTLESETARLEAALDAELTEWHVHLDTRRHRLGAYTIVLRYNPNVGRIHEIRPCSVQRFKGSPEYDPASFSSGVTRVTSLDAFPGRRPENEYHLLTVIFRKFSTGTLEASAELEKAYDEDDKPIRARVVQPNFTYAFP